MKNKKIRAVRRVSVPAFLTFFLAALLPAGAAAQTWLQASPTGAAPDPRAQQSAVFDSKSQKMIIFGGLASPNGDPNGSSDRDDVWTLQTGANPGWSKPTLSSGPIARDSHSAIYDPASGNMTIFGGKNGGTCLNDTWVLSGAAGVSPAWSQGPTAPFSLIGASAVYDPASNRMILFGGRPCGSGPNNDLWVLSDANGVSGSWTQLHPSGSLPPTRSFHSAVYNPQTNVMIVFGGAIAPSPGFANDLWVLLNANGVSGSPTWKQLQPNGAPPAIREAHTAVYDPRLDRMTIFGGSTTLVNGGLLNDTWVLYNASGLGGTPTWVQLSPAGSVPVTRAGATAVYEDSSGALTLFGGDSTLLTNDVWTLQNAVG
ncbi:MAG TPA: kelch repeat-containing protein, partial [Bryobacteraceae bacterium]